MKYSKIEWCDHTFNPWEGCTKVGPGCDHCYAENRNARFGGGKSINWGPGAPRRRTSSSNWQQPLKWNAEAKRLGVRYRVFCASLADVFDNEVDTQWRIELISLICKTPHLDWLLLTKRIGNAAGMLESAFRAAHGQREGWADNYFPNVWLGATIVNQAEADRDIPKLLAVPAAKRFLSMEPLLGAVNVFSQITGELLLNSGNDYEPGWLDWIIVGGESGPKARPMHPDWARRVRDQCEAAGVPFMFKQFGEFLPASANIFDPEIADVPDSKLFWTDGSKWDQYDGQRVGVDLVVRVGKKAAGRLLDGRTWDGVPT